jgi:hypothetical protein
MTPTSLTNQTMRITRAAVFAGALAFTASCQDFLDVNTNPNGPEVVTANLYLPPMLHWMVADPQWDGRFVGRYVQNWFFVTTSLSTWDRMGYDPGSDNGAQTWRDVYWSLGQNLVDMNQKAEAEQRWDLLGVGMILKGWGWMSLASLHGDIIVKQAIDQTRFSFDYDTEEYALQEARKLLDSAIVLLQRTDGAVDAAYLGRTDKIYGGDRTKWLKYAYGLRAILRNRYSNKGGALYDPAAVIADVDASFAGNADDALLQFPATQNDDRNFNGPTRGNITSYRQTEFVVNLMNGTEFNGTVDPRMSRMLAPAPDGQYRGLNINTVGFGALAVNQRPNNLFGYTGAVPAGSPSRYIFSDKSRVPAMTYSQLQFVKAEAAFRMGNRALALTAYTNGISSHIDFVNARNADDGQQVTPISAAEKAAFLASPNIVPTAANLTMTHIMAQKYIAQFGWGFFEQWMDLRRFRYTDSYPGESRQAFPGFAPPTNIYADNGGKVVQRLRPRFNSEYVWNQAGLSKITPISGLATDYQTSELWITKP